MKKYILFLIVFALFSFGLSLNSATAANCAPGELFHSATGKPCSTATVVECPAGHKFSSSTGQPCTAWTGTATTTTTETSTNFKIGSRGEAVKLFQQTLRDKGFLTGKADGIYGPMTYRAAQAYHKQYPPISIVLPPPCPLVMNSDGTITHDCAEPSTVTISGVSGPQSLKVNEQGTWTVKASSTTGGNLSYSVNWGDEYLYAANSNAANQTSDASQSATFTHTYAKAGIYNPTFTVTSSNTINCITTPCPSNEGKAKVSLTVNVVGANTSGSITVVSPNGGEKWAKGTTQKISWDELSLSSGVRFYDIVLQPTCGADFCTDVYRAPYTIAKKVSGESYKWSVGTVMALATASAETTQNTTAPIGAYLIKVCSAGTNICDFSDKYFNITSGTVSTGDGYLYLNPESLSLKVGGTATLQAMYQPPMPPCPSGFACAQVMPAPYAVSADWDSSDTKVAKVAFKNNCPPGALCGLADMIDYKTVVVTGVGAGTATIKAVYTNPNGTASPVSASAKITVASATTSTTPKISSIYPSSGVAGSTVTITGTGFTRAGNKIKFGNLNSEENPDYNLSSNGTSITFKVPTSNYFSCWDSPTVACKIAATMTAPGKYDVSVINVNGTSNAVTFTVEESEITPCLSCIPIEEEKTVLGVEDFNFTQLLKKGSIGNEVMELQKFLSKAGYYTGVVDGNFGTNTESAVIKLQNANGLTPDGIVGPMVRAILNK